MVKKILYLEDNGYLLNQTLGFLEEDGYEVKSVTRIDNANEYLEKESYEFDCIITDLNMEDSWLKEYRGESNGGLLSGWVWLMHYVYNKEKYRTKPCIIYSGYIQDLMSYLEERGESTLPDNFPIHFVTKGGNPDNGYTALYTKLKEL